MNRHMQMLLLLTYNTSHFMSVSDTRAEVEGICAVSKKMQALIVMKMQLASCRTNGWWILNVYLSY